MRVLSYSMLLSIIWFKTVLSLKILQFGEGYSSSHVLFNYRLAQSLTRTGNDVTIIVMKNFMDISSAEPPKNIREFRFGVVHVLCQQLDGIGSNVMFQWIF